MSVLRINDSGNVWLNTERWPTLDDFEAWMIRAHNEVLAARAARTPPACPEPRCQRPVHPDHVNGHLIIGSTWPDRKERRDQRLGDDY